MNMPTVHLALGHIVGQNTHFRIHSTGQALRVKRFRRAAVHVKTRT